MDRNQGYTILKAVMLENGRGFALGEHPRAPSPFVTWACYDDEHGARQYENIILRSTFLSDDCPFCHLFPKSSRLLFPFHGIYMLLSMESVNLFCMTMAATDVRNRH